MFDVYWNDPAQETVGQRKGQKKSAQDPDNSNNQHRHLPFFKHFNSKRKDFAPNGTLDKSTAAGIEETASSFEGGSGIGIASNLSIQELPANSLPEPQELPSEMVPSSSPKHNSSCTSYSNDTRPSSLFSEAPLLNTSGWTDTPNTPDSVRSSAKETPAQFRRIYPVNPKPYTIRRKPTQDTISSLNQVERENHSTSEIFTSSGEVPGRAPDHHSKMPALSTFLAPELPVSETCSPETLTVQVGASNATPQIIFASSSDERTPLLTENKSENRELTIGKAAILNQSALKSTDSTSRTPETLSSSGPIYAHLNQIFMALSQTRIRYMKVASQKIMLQRLQEEWPKDVDTEIYEEMEAEKQWWLLMATRALYEEKKLQDIGAEKQRNTPQTEISYTSSKMLSLHESHASASFLYALTLTTATELHHLSTIVLPEQSYPAILSRTASPPLSELPYAENTFSSIYASNLPALMPSPSIPAILKECHRILLPGKPLILKLLDPSPLPGTAGPRLQSWLNKNLLLDLEMQFRCLNPSRVFPLWLPAARLMAPGSTIVTTRFAAATAGAETGEELKMTIGRMLWKQIWGGFIQGVKMWWENEQIVEECLNLGTCWEYLIIEAVKQE